MYILSTFEVGWPWEGRECKNWSSTGFLVVDTIPYVISGTCPTGMNANLMFLLLISFLHASCIIDREKHHSLCGVEITTVMGELEWIHVLWKAVNARQRLSPLGWRRHDSLPTYNVVQTLCQQGIMAILERETRQWKHDCISPEILANNTSTLVTTWKNQFASQAGPRYDLHSLSSMVISWCALLLYSSMTVHKYRNAHCFFVYKVMVAFLIFDPHFKCLFALVAR
jgi:hypothetical protein